MYSNFLKNCKKQEKWLLKLYRLFEWKTVFLLCLFNKFLFQGDKIFTFSSVQHIVEMR